MEHNQLQPVRRSDYSPPDFFIDHIHLEFDLDAELTTVRAALTVRKNQEKKNGSPHLVLQGEGLTLLAVWCNGKRCSAIDFKLEQNTLTIFSVPENSLIETEVHIQPAMNTALKGLYLSNQHFCTQCEAEGFRHITYFLDRPDNMSRMTTKIIADSEHYPVLLSNGNLIDQGILPQGKKWVVWEDPFKKPCYLFALVAGDYDCLEDFFVTASGKRVKLEIYTDKGQVEKCQHAMAALKKAMRWDEEKYGREYDLAIYMIVAVADFNMGAMENRGLNIFNTKYILASPATATDSDFLHVDAVVAHEYFHNWTGNRITCRDWFQLSLKEGLTVYREQEFTADTTSRTVARIDQVDYLRTHQFQEDAGPLAHPVLPDSYLEINNFYTVTIYEKGAELIRMICTLVGAENFRKGMDRYFAKYDGQAVTIEEFISAHEEASGMDLQQFRLWYTQAGTPTLTILENYDAIKKIYTLTCSQVTAPTPGQPNKKALPIPIKTGLLNSMGEEIWQGMLLLDEAEKTFIFENIETHPVPSLLRDFSAPVRLNYAYSDEALLLLFLKDKNLFNRREAGFQFAVNCLLQKIKGEEGAIEKMQAFAKACHDVCTIIDDPWVLAKILSLPTEKYLAGLMTVIDVDGIHAAHELFLKIIAETIHSFFLATYQALLASLKNSFQFDATRVGQRALKNCCLFYLCHAENSASYHETLLQQFHAALGRDMTDTIAALAILVNIPGELREMALAAFHLHYQEDALAMDKWFSLQAGSKLPGALTRVQALMQHPAFDIRNPNRVYALIGGFTNNAVQFHARDGAGYAFLAEQVILLDTLNPQIAAAMVKPLTDWRRYDSERQQFMCAALHRIAAQKKLSPDLFERVHKSLPLEENFHHVT